MQITKIVLLLTALLSANAMADSIIGSQPAVTAPVIDTVPAGTIIPMLEMQFNCGTCEHDNKIKALVEGAFLDQADLEKATVDELNKTMLNVTHFRNRGKARFFIGALAGADNISGSISCNGVAHPVSDTAISAINGIESVARNVGKDAYKAIKACVLGTTAESAQTPVTAPIKAAE